MGITVTGDFFSDSATNRLMEKIIAPMQSAYVKKISDIEKNARLKAKRELSVWQEKYVRDLFLSKMNDFYSGYAGGDGGMEYNRNHSLLKDSFLSFESDNEGMFSNTVYNENELTQFERGVGGAEGLYDLVFVKGYHGGAYGKTAETASEYGNTPAYRTPVGVWCRWGNIAAKSDSPKDSFEKEIEKLNAPGGLFQQKFSELYKAELRSGYASAGINAEVT